MRTEQLGLWGNDRYIQFMVEGDAITVYRASAASSSVVLVVGHHEQRQFALFLREMAAKIEKLAGGEQHAYCSYACIRDHAHEIGTQGDA